MPARFRGILYALYCVVHTISEQKRSALSGEWGIDIHKAIGGSLLQRLSGWRLDGLCEVIGAGGLEPPTPGSQMRWSWSVLCVQWQSSFTLHIAYTVGVH